MRFERGVKRIFGREGWDQTDQDQACRGDDILAKDIATLLLVPNPRVKV